MQAQVQVALLAHSAVSFECDGDDDGHEGDNDASDHSAALLESESEI